MNTKEAIEFCEYMIERNVIEGRNEKYINMIELLQRGEKYEKIEKGIKQYCLILENQNVLKEVIRLEQKHFPKPSKNFTEKVMEKINKK